MPCLLGWQEQQLDCFQSNSFTIYFQSLNWFFIISLSQSFGWFRSLVFELSPFQAPSFDDVTASYNFKNYIYILTLHFIYYQWCKIFSFISFSSVQSLSRIRLFATPWTAVPQAFLSVTNFQSMLKLMSIELVMPSNHLILCCPLLLLPSIFAQIRVFSS